MAEIGQIIGIIIGISVIIAVLYYVYAVVVGGYDSTMKNEPWLLRGTKSANEMVVVPGNRLPLSSDGQYGIEFSYSFWIFTNQWSNHSTFKDGNQHILHRGSTNADPLQAPGIWLAKNTNSLIVNMNTFARITESCQIDNLPANKWVHVVVVLMNRYLDIYINGDLKKRCLLEGLPRQNPGNVYLNAFGGFQGYMSNARYFNYALPLWKIDQLLAQGPSDMPVLSDGERPPYLANDWWMTKQPRN